MTRQGINSLAAALALLVICCGLCTCGGANLAELPPDDLGYVFESAYMLYVEEVMPPEVVYEDEDSSFHLRVSADANPSALRGLSEQRWSRVAGYWRLYSDPQERWMLDAFVSTDIDEDAEPTDMLPMSIPGMPVGEWVIVIRGAADRSLGGREYKYYRFPSPGPVAPPEDMKEIRFTVNVIPRPEE